MNEQLPKLDYSKCSWRLTPEEDERLNRRFKLKWSVKNCITCEGDKTFKWFAPGRTKIVTYDCNCIEQYKMFRYFLFHGVQIQYQQMGWFDAHAVDREAMEFVLTYFDQRAQHRRTGKGLYLHGSPGTGKTLLGSIVLKQYIADGDHGIFSTFHDLLEGKSNGWANEDDRDHFIQRVRNADVLMMDDPGKESRGSPNQIEFTRSVMDDILRFRGGMNLPTIITSNQRLDEFTLRYGESVGSLVSGSCRQKFVGGEDWRAEKDKQDEREQALGLRRPIVIS